MGNTLLAAFALMLILEGCAPLFAPAQWREVLSRLIAMRDGQIRTIGLSAVMGGVALLLLLSL